MTEFTLKNKQPEKWDLKWRPGYRIVHIECNGHYLHIENQGTGKTRSCNVKDIVLEPAVEFWNINTQFGRSWEVHQPPCQFTNHQAEQLKMNTLLMYIVTHKLPTLMLFVVYCIWLHSLMQQSFKRARSLYYSNQY